MSEEEPSDESSEELSDESSEEGTEITRCDYCRLPCPTTPIEAERDGVAYAFCSEACRDAIEDSERPATQYHGFRRLQTGVSALDGSLPQGIPRNSFVLLSSLVGSRAGAVQTELAWRAIQRGEPAVFVTFLEPPVSVIQSFLDLEWNVLPSLEAGDLRIVDCFTARVEDRDRMHERMDDWNTHLRNVAEDATVAVSDPSDLSQVESRLDGVLEDVGMQDDGIVVLDSLTEVGSLVQPVQAYNFVKDIRADVCKGRFVPIFAGASITGEGDGFPHDLGYMVDGIVELRQTEEVVEGALVKQLRVRKMSGVLTYPEWAVYEYTAGEGIVTFDPHEQMADASAADDAEATPEESESGNGGQPD